MTAKQTLETLRKSLFTPSPSITSSRFKHLFYYPPDISPLKLSQQDMDLAGLNLVDPWIEERKIKQDILVARGKPLRVCVVNGPIKRDEKSEGKKKRRK